MAREIRVEILGDARDFSRATRTASGDAARLEGTFRRVGDGASRMSRAIGLAAVGGIAIGAHAVRGFLEAAEESQQVTRQTAAVIRSMGGVANVSAQQVSRLSTRLSLMSGIDDELIQSGQNVLLTFGQVRNEIGEGNNVFDRATEAALNMSVALGTDMNSAAMMVGKALNDPIRGLTALRRSGIQFTREQEDQIRMMVESGNVMGAQTVMLRELERQFGGSAEAQATSSDRLRVAWGNIQEQIGTALLPAFESVATWMTESLPGFMTTAGDVIDTAKTKWEEFTTALFGDEDWDSFWADVSAGIDDFSAKWDDFTNDLGTGWDEFVSIVSEEGPARDGFFDRHKRGVQAFVDWGKEHAPWLFGEPWPFSGPGGFNLATDTPITSSFDPTFGLGDDGPGPLPSAPALPPQQYSLLPPAMLPRSVVQNDPSWGMRKLTGPFADGGVVPGRLGSPQLAMVHAGETILPTHKSSMGGVTQIFYGEPDDFIMKVAEVSNGRAVREVRRDLNWSV